MARQERIMQQLFLLAQDTLPAHGKRFISAIVDKNRIIAYGTNQAKTHTFQLEYNTQSRHTLLSKDISDFKDTLEKYSFNIHSETNAIKNAVTRVSLERLAKCDIYVARAKLVNGVFVYGNAKPCEGCFSAIESFGLNNLYYTTDTGTVERVRLK